MHKGQKLLGHSKKELRIKIMDVYCFIAHEKRFKFNAQPQTLDVLYVCDVIIKINVRYVIINRFLRYMHTVKLATCGTVANFIFSDFNFTDYLFYRSLQCPCSVFK